VAVGDWTLSQMPSFPMSDIDGRAFLLVDQAGIEHLRLIGSQRSVQLAVRGASVLRPSRLLTDLRLPYGKERSRLAAITDLNALVRPGCRLREHAGDLPSSDRLRTVLQALDGFLAGASQREIAEALFGVSQVRRDWRDAGGHMRDRVRRAIRRGRTLMTGGYLSLLR
jgi:hypothetical protein